MSNWKVYSWVDFIHEKYPWSYPPETLGGAYASSNVRLDRLEDPAAQAEARALGLDVELAFATVLAREWHNHPNGARVLFDSDHVAIELGPGEPDAA